jgi:hypothetical protein
MMTAPVLQPTIGYLLDHFKGDVNSYALEDYQLALLIVPIALVIASILAQFLPEKSRLFLEEQDKRSTPGSE